MHRHLSQTEKSGKSLSRIGKAWLERLVFPPVAGGGSVKHLLLSELALPRGWQETASFASFTSQPSQADGALWRAVESWRVCHRQILVKAVSVGAFLSWTDRLMSHAFFHLNSLWRLTGGAQGGICFFLSFSRKHACSAFQREKSHSFRAEPWSSAKGLSLSD